MLKRNWTAVAQVKNYHLRVAVSLATDLEEVAGFARGFPQLFFEGEDEGPLRIPLSVLKEAATKFAASDECLEPHVELVRHFSLDLALEDAHLRSLELPWSFRWGSIFEKPDPPSIVVNQLIGQKAEAGLTVTYEGRRHLVFFIRPWGIWQIGEVISDVSGVTDLELIDAEFVDLSA